MEVEKSKIKTRLVELTKKLNDYEKGSKERINAIHEASKLLEQLELEGEIHPVGFKDVEDAIFDEFGINDPMKYLSIIASKLGSEYSVKLICFRMQKDVEGIFILGKTSELDKIFDKDLYYISKSDKKFGSTQFNNSIDLLNNSEHTFIFRPYFKNFKAGEKMYNLSDKHIQDSVYVKYGTNVNEIIEFNTIISELDSYINANGFNAISKLRSKVKEKK